MEKILLVTAVAPSKLTGGLNYTLKVIEDLSQEYSVDVCYFKYKHEAPFTPFTGNTTVVKVVELKVYSKLFNCIKLFFLHPFFTCRLNAGLMYYILKNRNKYSYFYFDFSQMFIYSLLLRNKVKFLMAHDIITQKYSRKNGLLNNINFHFVRFSERLILRLSHSKIFCFSNKDRQLIKDIFNIESNKVDFFINDEIKKVNYDTIRLSHNFMFLGAWARKENSDGLEWFLDNVMPQLGREISFTVVGSGLSRRLLAKLGHYSTIRVLGFVDDPYQLLAGSLGLIAPLFQGAGVKVKVIESLACGTPVIGTKIAFEGIEGVESRHLLECTEPQDYVKAIQQLESIDLSSKRRLREKFLSMYPKDTFKDYLNQHG